MKRLFDVIFSSIGLLIMSPVLLVFLLFVWLQDFHSPLYIAPRVGKHGKLFRMVKLRSMVMDADKSGVDSTSTDDRRITTVGKLIRKYKLDEFTQLWNVLCGHMSLVGPRPNVQADVALYTEVEKKLLDVRPGITDFSSIVFADEGEILAGSKDPDVRYNQIIRPWKSRLGLLYVENQSLLLDVQLIMLTVIGILSRKRALKGIVRILEQLGVDKQLLMVASRQLPLQPYPPPGSDTIVTSRAADIG